MHQLIEFFNILESDEYKQVAGGSSAALEFLTVKHRCKYTWVEIERKYGREIQI